MNHITKVPLYIRENNTNKPNAKFDYIEIPIGTELTFIKYGDESTIYSSDPVHANCYSGEVNGFKFHSKFLYLSPNNMWEFYQIK